MLKKLSQYWNYFKKGRSEIGLLMGLFSMILSYSIKFNVDFTIKQYVIFTLVFGIFCVFLGIFLAEKVEPENNRISPYAQDGLMSAIYLQSSLLSYYEGDIEKAKEDMLKAQELREKWLR